MKNLLLSLITVILIISCTQKKEAPMQSVLNQDTLANASNYAQLHSKFAAVFAFAQNTDLATLPMGRADLDSSVFYIVSEDSGKTQAAARLEAHKKYIDIQIVISGEESYGWKSIDACEQIDTPYDAEKDIMFFRDAPEKWYSSPAGSFIIFFPQDAHAPMVGDGLIRKVVFKVPVE